jgi:hypothetical protein
MAHAIKISKGMIDPPQLFVAQPPPPPLEFQKAPFVGKNSADFGGKWETSEPEDVPGGTRTFMRVTIFPSDNNGATARHEIFNSEVSLESLDGGAEGRMEGENLVLKTRPGIADTVMSYSLRLIDPTTIQETATSTSPNFSPIVRNRMYHRK